MFKNFDGITILNTLVISAFNYVAVYLLSSREVLVDFKNIGFIILFSALWMAVFKATSNKRLLLCIYAVAEIFAFLVPCIGYATEPFFLQRLMKDFLFWYTLPLPFLYLKLLANGKKNLILSGSFLCCTILMLLLLVSIALGYYVVLGVKISADSILAIMQTNAQESKEFLQTYFSATKVMVIAFIILLIPLVQGVAYAKLKINVFTGKRMALFSLVLILLGCNFMFAGKTYLVRAFATAHSLDMKLQDFSKNKELRVQKLNKEGDTVTNMNENFALVIGETHTRTHMSVFGYDRETTPWLQSQVEKGNVILHENSYAASAVTNAALSLALTERSQYNGIKDENALTIVEAARAAGYKIVWISNQLNDTMAGLIAMEADETHWLNESKNDTYLRQKNNMHDNLIIEKLRNLKIGGGTPKTLYVIHLLGSHASYNCRYPDEFKKWDDETSLVNAYDNSILYNDYIMSQVSNILMQEMNVSMMVYFSDHGEELQKKFCHGNEFFRDNYKKMPSVKDVIKIPIYFLYSDAYKQKYPRIINQLNDNKRKYFTNDMMFDTMLGVMGIRGKHYNSKQDFSSSDYGFDLEQMKTLDGAIDLKDCI